jgi:hypothetical protein
LWGEVWPQHESMSQASHGRVPRSISLVAVTHRPLHVCCCLQTGRIASRAKLASSASSAASSGDLESLILGSEGGTASVLHCSPSQATLHQGSRKGGANVSLVGSREGSATVLASPKEGDKVKRGGLFNAMRAALQPQASSSTATAPQPSPHVALSPHFKAASASSTSLLGASLVALHQQSLRRIPQLLEECCTWLRSKATNVPHLFRTSGDTDKTTELLRVCVRVRHLLLAHFCQVFEANAFRSIEAVNAGPHEVAALLKLFLRSLIGKLRCCSSCVGLVFISYRRSPDTL